MRVIYYSSWGDLWFFLVIIMGFVVVGLFEHGVDDYFFLGILAGGLYLLWIVFLRYRTYIKITDERILTNVGQKSLGTDELDIYSIKHIVRARAFWMKNWGSLMILYLINDKGELRQTNLREANYDESTLKELLQHLKRINPRIELDSTYESLLNGTLPKRLHSIYSEHTPAEVDAQVREKLGIKEKGSV